MVVWLKDKKRERERERDREREEDDLPVLVSCRSVTLVILSSEGNVPVAHGSTLIWLMEAFD